MLRRALFSRRTLAIASGSAAVVAAGGYYYLNSGPTYPSSTKETRRPPPPWTPPSRAEMLSRLKASSKPTAEGYTEEFDLLVVGGGATGAGVALDAASRGLKVALVERDDFSSGGSHSCAPSFGDLPSRRVRLERVCDGGRRRACAVQRGVLLCRRTQGSSA